MVKVMPNATLNYVLEMKLNASLEIILRHDYDFKYSFQFVLQV